MQTIKSDALELKSTLTETKSTKSKESKWLEDLRLHANSSFQNKGYPTTKDESWKYTNLKDFSSRIFTQVAPELCLVSLNSELSSFLEDKRVLENKKGKKEREKHLLNLMASRSNSNPNLGPDFNDKVTIKYIKDAIQDDDKIFKDYLNISFPDGGYKAFFLENTARFTDGVLIYVPKGVHIEVPLYLLYSNFVSAAQKITAAALATEKEMQNSENPAKYIRNLIILEEDAHLEWIEDFIFFNSLKKSGVDSSLQETNIYLHHIVNEIVLGRNSR